MPAHRLVAEVPTLRSRVTIAQEFIDSDSADDLLAEERYEQDSFEHESVEQGSFAPGGLAH